MCDQYTFLEGLDPACHTQLRWQCFSYLHVEGNDFRLEPVAARFGGLTVSWKMRLPTTTNEDTDSEFVEDFYTDSARLRVF